jgi:hypothetical protein
LFQLISAYSLSHNTIESAETSRLSNLPNQPFTSILVLGEELFKEELFSNGMFDKRS